MSSRAKLAAFAAILVVLLVAGLGVGSAVGPLRAASTASAHGHQGTNSISSSPAASPTGLSASQGGYTFALDDPNFIRGVTRPFSFRILAPDGRAVTSFDTRHERDLHLVVVSSDLADYQHVHPELGGDGTWTANLALPHAGTYRVYADFAPAGGQPYTLGAELMAAGELRPQTLAPPSKSATIGDYGVTVESDLVAGADGQLIFRVQRGFDEVADLEPYLGTYGHLVAIRAADHAYLHVHPSSSSSAREVAFAVQPPSPGTYRLFFDFQHSGVVHSAAFTIDVPAQPVGGSSGSQSQVHNHAGH